MINIFNVLHKALSDWSSPQLPYLRRNCSIFSINLNQFFVVSNWFVLKLFRFKFSPLKNENKIRIVLVQWNDIDKFDYNQTISTYEIIASKTNGDWY